MTLRFIVQPSRAMRLSSSALSVTALRGDFFGGWGGGAAAGALTAGAAAGSGAAAGGGLGAGAWAWHARRRGLRAARAACTASARLVSSKTAFSDASSTSYPSRSSSSPAKSPLPYATWKSAAGRLAASRKSDSGREPARDSALAVGRAALYQSHDLAADERVARRAATPVPRRRPRPPWGGAARGAT